MFSLKARLSFYHTEVRDGAFAFGRKWSNCHQRVKLKLFWWVIIVSVTLRLWRNVIAALGV